MIHYQSTPRKVPTTGEVLYFPTAHIVGNVGLEEIAQNITDNCTVTIHDVRGVLSALQEHIIKTVRDGKSVRFKMLGSFHPTIQGESTPVMEDFTPALIRKVNCRFTPSSKFTYEMSIKNPRVKFKLLKEKKVVPPTGGGEQTV